MVRRFLFAAIVFLVVALGLGGTAFAHNSLDSSVPADGETVAEQPDQLLLVFAKDVPLETLTVTLIDPTGVRSDLRGSRHGATPKEVLVPLPSLSAGAYTVRWRLVGPDGHAITDRVQFGIAVAPVDAITPATLPEVAFPPVDSFADDEGWSTPGWTRWLLRYAAYLAMMVLAGVTLTGALVVRRPMQVQNLMTGALAVVVVTAFLQLWILAADIAGTAPWSAISKLGVAAENTTGMALVVRMMVAAGWWLIFRDRPHGPEVNSDLVVLLSLGLLATWSFAGHSRSMRWPWLGVPADVIHHGAAAAWIGGLTIVGAQTLRSRHTVEVVEAVRRFSTLAAACVGLIVATGVLQAVRLVGSLGNVVSTTHGKLLIAKVALLGAGLWFAARNRRLVQHRVRADLVTEHDMSALRATMRRELLVCVVIIGVTASLVVSLPATADEAASSYRTSTPDEVR